MARIRTIKPQHVNDKELSKLSLQAHLFWILSWCFSDDEGVIENDPLLLKSQLFPRRTDIRIEQVEQWIDQLIKARFVIPFTHDGEGYLLHRTFKIHQKIDRPQPSKIPSETIRRIIDECSTNVRPCIVEESTSKSKVSTRAKALVVAVAPTQSENQVKRKKYESVTEQLEGKTKGECWNAIKDFIQTERPLFIEPYVDMWNVFANTYQLKTVKFLNDKKRKKFQIRIAEQAFDFVEILSKIKKSSFLKGNNPSEWKVDFEFIINSENNYIKILEDKYD
jgi:hypothetical protein